MSILSLFGICSLEKNYLYIFVGQNMMEVIKIYHFTPTRAGVGIFRKTCGKLY